MIQRKIFPDILRNIKPFRVCGRLFSSDKIEKTRNRQRFLRQSQGLHAFRPEECPENPTIILFPGQGSQFVGMAKTLEDVPDARNLFEFASEILGLDKNLH